MNSEIHLRKILTQIDIKLGMFHPMFQALTLPAYVMIEKGKYEKAKQYIKDLCKELQNYKEIYKHVEEYCKKVM